MTRYGRIQARPRIVTRAAPVGLLPLEGSGSPDSYLYVSPRYSPDRASPLVLMFHGSGGHAHHGKELLRELADRYGLIVVAPASGGYTWDMLLRRHGPDVNSINRVLERVFSRYTIDPRYMVASGFSDGASYALSLGLTNSDLFTHVVAFSPGFTLPVSADGSRSRIFIAHGTRDEILPISACSRRIVRQLESAGFEVDYVEFAAGHRIPPEIANQAVAWFKGAAESVPPPAPVRPLESPRRQGG